MSDTDWLATQFEANRTHLRAVAYQMLGSQSEAEDAVQESWLRLSRSDPSQVDNLAGWLTTVTARICLDMLRSRRTRREEPMQSHTPEPSTAREVRADPEHEAILADSVGPALLVVLDTLAPAERIAFVMHDLFGVPFDEIAEIVGRSPAATRQLASRARRRVQGAEPAPGDVARQRTVAAAFLAAARDGDFDALLAALDPDVVFRNDPSLVPEDVPLEVHGADAVAAQFSGRARAAQPALVDGVVGVAIPSLRRPAMVLVLTFAGDRIATIDAVGDITDVAIEALEA
jgi:RNA polymerase sigma-70 factor (ECF subfamily)